MMHSPDTHPADDGADALLAGLVARHAPFAALAEAVLAGDVQIPLSGPLAESLLEFDADLREARRRASITEG